jgi:SAM-dependent methyltransferase
VPDHWFEPMAEHMGRAYLRYSFTKGTAQEVAFLMDALSLSPGMRVLDIGCGPGRHAHALARLGVVVHGIDISQRFIDIAVADAPPGATFERGDARALDFDAEFDAVISLCQGGFGLLDGGEQDEAVLGGMHRALRPGGCAALSAFSSYFQVRYLEDSVFEAGTGVNHERTVIKDESGRDLEVDLWTSCWTPKELRFALSRAGFAVDHIWSVEPGRYDRRPPTIETPEFLVIARR